MIINIESEVIKKMDYVMLVSYYEAICENLLLDKNCQIITSVEDLFGNELLVLKVKKSDK